MISFDFNNQLAWRINILFAFFLLLAALLLYRFADLQIIEGAKDSRGDASLFENSEWRRAEIFLQDHSGETTPLAVNKDFFTVYVEPARIKNKEDAAKSLSEILQIPYEKVLERASKENDPYEIIAKKISDQAAGKIKALKLSGVGVQSEKGRYHPHGRMASHVSGFLGMRGEERVGQYGLEGFYDGALASDKVEKILLSLDQNAQFKIEELLAKAVDQWKAERGSVIIMEPKTGRILGMASFPDFDPNNYASVEDISVFNNLSISGQFELGSVFKPITMAIGLDNGAVTPKTTYEDQGFVAVDDRIIRNWDRKPHGKSNMTDVLKNSLNAGIVFVQQKIPKEVFSSYIKNFGFGDKLGVDLAGEVSGNVSNLKDGKGRNVDFANISFGQGISVTPLQMLTAISAIGNDGALVRPRLADKIFFTDGSVDEIKTEVKRSVISEKTSETLTKMLVETMENHSKIRNVKYFIAGKTGTAEIPDRSENGYSEDMIHSVVGYAPAYNPRFAVLVKIDRPQGVEFATYSVIPVFYEIMNYLLTYYEVPPDF